VRRLRRKNSKKRWWEEKKVCRMSRDGELGLFE
jgi:hypothetical protein